MVITKFSLGEEVRIKSTGHTGIVIRVVMQRYGYPTEPKEATHYGVSTYTGIVSDLAEDDLEPVHKAIGYYATFCESQVDAVAERIKYLRAEAKKLIKEVDALLARADAEPNPYNNQA